MTPDKPARKLTLAHSPDSDDAFMFWALKQGYVGADGIEFEHVLDDIQSLNQAALEGRHDITAISLHAYPYVANQYFLMNVGASVGDGYGPIVVAKEQLKLDDLGGCKVAIPGSLTTAALLLKIAVPGLRTEEMRFDQILESVRRGYVDAGLVIHEGQVTYQREGLNLVVDFGKWWKAETGLPLPLGANIIRRALGEEAIAKSVAAIRSSIVYGLEHRDDALRFAQEFGRDLVQPDVDKFVSMYVNDYTVDWGETGRAAARELLRRGAEAGIVPEIDNIEFVG